ncbi:MAG: 1-deoxy-D-xylulose-5-phosphate reductoisomerase [Lachnospiraceae bacterium]|nr:1-deoxy-D-xylulose-5-phosphate reductoisomerase [Lachnospiraceae bacterium]
MKTIAILGSTGSIGTQTLEILREYPGRYKVSALAAGSNDKLLEEQIREFRPSLAVLYDKEAAARLRLAVSDIPGLKVLSGMDGLIEAATLSGTDMVLTAVVGMIGIRPTIAAINAGKDIALANKETLVCAGHIIMPLIKQKGVSLYPVDSEHSAIFQSLNGEPKKRLSKIWLTCSGGPFRGKKRSELEHVTAADALRHPNWSMGKKITIDSASMVNKGLEVMEAHWLFDASYEQIKVLIHPQSVVHSMVEYADGAVIAQLGVPDMRLPIQYALFYPDRLPAGEERPRVDFYKLGQLDFSEPDRESFPALDLALKAGLSGGSLPTVFNAANEEAVALFLKGRISFLSISELIESAMEAHNNTADPDVDTILAAEAEARRLVREKTGT